MTANQSDWVQWLSLVYRFIAISDANTMQDKVPIHCPISRNSAVK